MVSENARRLREEKRLTLDEAARLTGVSRSMLAQIEKGGREPHHLHGVEDRQRLQGVFHLAGGAGPGAAGAAAGQ